MRLIVVFRRSCFVLPRFRWLADFCRRHVCLLRVLFFVRVSSFLSVF